MLASKPAHRIAVLCIANMKPQGLCACRCNEVIRNEEVHVETEYGSAPFKGISASTALASRMPTGRYHASDLASPGPKPLRVSELANGQNTFSSVIDNQQSHSHVRTSR